MRLKVQLPPIRRSILSHSSSHLTSRATDAIAPRSRQSKIGVSFCKFVSVKFLSRSIATEFMWNIQNRINLSLLEIARFNFSCVAWITAKRRKYYEDQSKSDGLVMIMQALAPESNVGWSAERFLMILSSLIHRMRNPTSSANSRSFYQWRSEF